jgi:transcriptional regulator with XRE-family HTH domain
MKDKKTYSLRALRLKAGLTLQELSDRTGISLATIQIFETSKERRRNYSITAKHTVADFFHVPIRLLFPEVQEQVDEFLGKRRQKTITVSIQEFKKG